MRPTLFPTLRLTDGKILIVEPAELAGRQVVRVDGTACRALTPNAVIVCEDNGHTYPATLTYWHLTGRHKGRARVALANGTGRTVHHRNITVEPTP